MRFLGVCLFYNDVDIAADGIEYLLNNDHELLVFDHGSDDGTREVVDRYSRYIRMRYFIPHTIPFLDLWGFVSDRIAKFAITYDWVSFPESDEFMEGPDRSRRYIDHLRDVAQTEATWIQFDNFVYWFTSADDLSIQSPIARVRHYCLWKTNCTPRVYAWRADRSNYRRFNHNPVAGPKSPVNFVTRHYQMRSEEHMHKRFERTAGLRQGGTNHHFDFMPRVIDRMRIEPHRLHVDDGTSELSRDEIFDWTKVYGSWEQLEQMLKEEDSEQS